MATRLKLDLGEYLPYLVNRVGAIIAERFSEEALAPHRLSIAMWRVLAVLASTGGQRQIDLSALTSVEASTLSRLVTRLVRLGLVTRARSTRSNREVAIRLSEKGAALVARLTPVAREYQAAAIAGLSVADIASLKRSLRLMYANMVGRTATAGSRRGGGARRTNRSGRRTSRPAAPASPSD